MKKKTPFIATIVLISSLVVFAACKPHGPFHGAFALDYLNETLDLTSEQQQQLAGIRDELLTKVEALHEDREEIHTTLKKQLLSDTVDKELIRRIISDHRARTNEVIDLAVDRLSDFHSGLSPEQRAKLVSKLEKLMQLRDERHLSR